MKTEVKIEEITVNQAIRIFNILHGETLIPSAESDKNFFKPGFTWEITDKDGKLVRSFYIVQVH